MVSNNYTRICFINDFEFGIYQRPDGSSDNEFKVVGRYWDRDTRILDEKILSYAESLEEAIEVISCYLSIGLTIDGVDKRHVLKGDYYLFQEDDDYFPLLLEEYIDKQTERLIKSGVIEDEYYIILEVMEKVRRMCLEKAPFKELPTLKENSIDGNRYSLHVSVN